DMRITILKWIGLPCCVGIGSSKTEAKIANHIAKKYPAFNSVCNLVDMDLCNKEAFFSEIDVTEVWGVGRKHSKKLQGMGINSVFDLACTDP
ncbi:DNA polymerase V subunit UmuC, partial [Acinetobacter baumannii]